MKTAQAISVTESGTVMLSKAVQRAKAVLPLVFQNVQSGIAMLFKELREPGIFRRLAEVKGTAPNLSDRIRNIDAFQRAAAVKGTASNLRH